MAQSDLHSTVFNSHIQSYKLIAPNLFDYLQLVDFVNDNKSYYYSTSPNKQTLTIYIYVYVYNFRITELMALLPAGIVMERDWHETSTLYI